MAETIVVQILPELTPSKPIIATEIIKDKFWRFASILKGVLTSFKKIKMKRDLSALSVYQTSV